MVRIEGDSAARPLCRGAGREADGRQFSPQGGGDAGQMEPVGIGENLLPVEGVARNQGEGGAGAVVGNGRRAVGRPLLKIVQPHPRPLPQHPGGVDAVFFKRGERRISHRIAWQSRDKGGLLPENREGDGHVGFRPAVADAEALGLHKAEPPLGRKTQQKLAEGDDFGHSGIPNPAQRGAILSFRCWRNKSGTAG